MSTRRMTLFAALALGVLSVGCPSEPETPGTAGDTPTAAAEQDPVERARAIRSALDAQPESAEDVLREHGLTIEEFEALMMRIAGDPELSARFAQGG